MSDRKQWTGATIVGQLNREWERLCDDSAAGRIAAVWAEADVRLAGLESLEAIEAASRRPIDHRTDLMLSALLERAVQRGEEGDLAARIMVQLMLGRAVITAHALRGLVRDAEERAQLVVVALWEAVRGFPAARRTTYIAPWLAWDVHARAKRAALAAGAEIPVGDATEYATPERPVNASEELAKVLAWAVAEGVLSTDEVELLAARYGSESPERRSWTSVADATDLARDRGVSQAAIRQRCSRAARKLSKAAARYVATNVF
ncbi:hypothetical protein NI17_010135 [Thermobifida halotolerans]|uniref:Uncharacterized protein n=1 Tax=Thermobifida halotolerans TaxID=483545 RepID=A0AA97M0V6_9ACTN|nr:hypothetical protein [Thermobifida halotolerans]UOE21433.1 hypothetical protein NI17_010135 [Thermobifida halotolerans]